MKRNTNVSRNRHTGLVQYLSCNVRASVCVFVGLCHFCGFLKRLNTSVYKCRNSNRSISKEFLVEKLGKDIGLRFSFFGSEMVNKFLVNFSSLCLVFATHCCSAGVWN